ncbi:hypothetical protein GC176_03105 [bacterium]|nr:hypothetical protein [bacterium]
MPDDHNRTPVCSFVEITESGATERSDVTGCQPLIAYQLFPGIETLPVPAPINRMWMDQTQQRFAYRCLPLTLANQAGWFLRNPGSFTARWNGGPRPCDTTLVFDEPTPNDRINSLFGYGTVTFNLPFLFRTPPAVNLWVKGPSNWPKHGIQALEGIVESDWTSATFTMNWKLTAPNEMVRFERGEPICMIVPFPRNCLDRVLPEVQLLSMNPALEADHKRWSADRDDFHRRIAARDPEALAQGWQKDYFQGRDPGRPAVDMHQTKLTVRPFLRADASAPVECDNQV